MRGEPSDASFLKSALPVTGRMQKARPDPYAPQTFCSPAEERGLLLDQLAALPDRIGWLWLRTESSEAIAMRTPDLIMPSGPEMDAAVVWLKNDPTFGGRMSRKLYDRLIADRDTKWKEHGKEDTTANETFAAAYRRMRGKEDNRHA